MFWESRRYSKIYRDLLLCAVNTSVIVSVGALYTNGGNRYFVEYFRSRNGEAAISTHIWWGLVSPTVAVAFVTYWQNLSSGTLHDFDAPQEKDVLRTIRLALQKQLSAYQSFNHWHVMSIAVFLCWAGRRSYPLIYNLRNTLVDNYDTLAVDFAMLLVALLLPVSSSSLLEAPGRQYTNLWFRLPWAALLGTGGGGCVAEAVRASDALAWLVQWAPRSTQYKFVTQILLSLGAAVLTELVGRTATISLMMPVITDVATTLPCNPLYLAIPVTIAASSTFSLPTSSFAVAYAYDRLGIGPWDLVVGSVMLKLVCIVAIILTVSTLGNFIFQWNQLPDWFSPPGSNASSPTMAAAVAHHVVPQ